MPYYHIVFPATQKGYTKSVLTLLRRWLRSSTSLRDGCPRLILRYDNVSFYHAILCFEVIGTQPTTLTRRKLCGKYFHNVVSHAPIQLRIISGESSNTEDEERYFTSIKGITRETPSHPLSHIIGNILIRLQAKTMFRELFDTCREDQETFVQKLAKSLPDFPDTLFPSFVLEKYNGRLI